MQVTASPDILKQAVLKASQLGITKAHRQPLNYSFSVQSVAHNMGLHEVIKTQVKEQTILSPQPNKT